DRPVRISQITIAAGVATVTTFAPHGRNSGDWVPITGALVNGLLANTYNGAYLISKLNDTQFTYSPSLPAPTVSPSGEMWIGRAPSHEIAIKLPIAPQGGNQYEIETYTPHYRTPANNVRMNSVYVTPLTG